jgi:hypothetical protein
VKLILALLLVLLISCSDNNTKTGKQILNFGSFTIEVPNSWTKLKGKGVDSYVGRIAIDNVDTVDFDLGWYSNKLTEDAQQIVGRSKFRDNDKLDTSEIGKVRNQNREDTDIYIKNKISWDTIDGRKAKIVSPIKSGIGTTGIYIDSLWISGSDVDRFNLYGNNLKPSNEQLFLVALKTLKFHKNK